MSMLERNEVGGISPDGKWGGSLVHIGCIHPIPLSGRTEDGEVGYSDAVLRRLIDGSVAPT